MLALLQGVSLLLLAKPRPGQTPQLQQLNPTVRYRVANALDPTTQFYMGGPGQEYFEVDTPPIRTQYAEVYWTVMSPVRLPAHIIERYDNKVMAITAHEVNVLRRNSSTGNESAVPCYESYNHHFTAHMASDHVELVPSSNPNPDALQLHRSHVDAQGRALEFRPILPGVLTNGIPASAPHHQSTQNPNNGNEHRQSYHQLPEGLVRLIFSPTQFYFTPMQINTREPGGHGTGPLPRSSAAPAHAPYVGILECPCTTRIKKQIDDRWVTASAPTCPKPTLNPNPNPNPNPNSNSNSNPNPPPESSDISSFEECVSAAQDLGLPVISNASGHPGGGCNVQVDLSRHAFVLHWSNGSNVTACGQHPPGWPHVFGTMRAAKDEQTLSELSVEIVADPKADNSGVTITFKGNASVWIGAAFGATKMDNAYAITIEPTADSKVRVTERKLGNHAAGRVLQPSLEVVSNSVSNGERTVVVRRPVAGLTADHFDFSKAAKAPSGGLQVLTARGSGAVLAQHVARSGAVMVLADAGADARTCLCRGEGLTRPFGQGVGTINGVPYSPACHSAPLTSLIEQRNPSCDVRTYVGGMQCCRHKTILLDEDQNPPPVLDEVFFRWRFYVRPYRAATDTPIFDLVWYISAADHSIEYDAPAAPPGTPPEKAIHVITSNFTGLDFLKRSHDVDITRAQDGVRLVQMGGHCHSPGCLSLELFNADTGARVCKVTPVAGTSDEAMDEKSYLYLPPCMWSNNATEGLPQPPVFFPNTNFSAIKRVNNSVYHYGIMAIFQSTGAYAK